VALHDGSLRAGLSSQGPETGCPAGSGAAGGGQALSAMGLPLSGRLSAASRVARESQARAPRLAPVRVAGAQVEAAEENPDWDDAAAHGADEKRGLELGFRA